MANPVRILGLVLAACSLAGSLAQAAPKRPAFVVSPAMDGITTAFQTHPLVAIGDAHGMAQQEDFYSAIMRDPRFARDVGNVVVEFGGASHQDTIDRYVAGENVPYTELRKVWTDVVGWIPTVAQVGFINFYAQVRETNLTLPPDRRIHVWLGEPQIDWSKINTHDEFMPQLALRDRHPADLIKQEILAKGKKALVIYGWGHFYTPDGLRALVEQDYPHAFFIVTPYTGYVEKACSAAFESKIKNWPNPALATPVKGTLLERNLRREGCHALEPGPMNFPPTWTKAQIAKSLADTEEKNMGIAGDALLYVGQAKSQTRTPIEPNDYLDLDFRQELNRRHEIMFGTPLTTETVGTNPASPRPFRP